MNDPSNVVIDAELVATMKAHAQQWAAWHKPDSTGAAYWYGRVNLCDVLELALSGHVTRQEVLDAFRAPRAVQHAD